MEKQIKPVQMDQVAEFDLGDLLPIALVFVVVAIAIAFGASVLTDVRAGFTANTTAYNATSDGLQSLTNISGKMGLLATVVVAAVIIGVIVKYFGGANR